MGNLRRMKKLYACLYPNRRVCIQGTFTIKLGSVNIPLEHSDVEFKIKCIKMHVIFDQALHILGIFNDTLPYVKGGGHTWKDILLQHC